MPPWAATVCDLVGKSFDIHAVLKPASAKPNAARRPAPPAPTTMASYSWSYDSSVPRTPESSVDCGTYNYGIFAAHARKRRSLLRPERRMCDDPCYDPVSRVRGTPRSQHSTYQRVSCWRKLCSDSSMPSRPVQERQCVPRERTSDTPQRSLQCERNGAQCRVMDGERDVPRGQQ